MSKFISRIFYLTIIVLLVKDNQTAIWAFLAQGITQLITTFYSFWILFSEFKFKFKLSYLKFYNLIRTTKLSFPFLINTITNNQINSFWGFGLTIFSGPSAMAIFSLGDQIYRAGGAFTNVISQTLRIYSLDASFEKIKKILLFFAFLFIFLGILACAFTDILIIYFFNDDYLPAISIIRLMIASWAIHGLSKLINYPILSEYKNFVWINKLTILILLIHFVLFCIWVYFFSSLEMLAFSFLIALIIQFIIFIFLVIISKKFHK